MHLDFITSSFDKKTSAHHITDIMIMCSVLKCLQLTIFNECASLHDNK